MQLITVDDNNLQVSGSHGHTCSNESGEPHKGSQPGTPRGGDQSGDHGDEWAFGDSRGVFGKDKDEPFLHPQVQEYVQKQLNSMYTEDDM